MQSLYVNLNTKLKIRGEQESILVFFEGGCCWSATLFVSKEQKLLLFLSKSASSNLNKVFCKPFTFCHPASQIAMMEQGYFIMVYVFSWRR